MGGFTEEQMADARRMLVHAIAVLTLDPMSMPTLAARNVIYHSEELMKALDAFYAGDEGTLGVFTGE